MKKYKLISLAMALVLALALLAGCTTQDPDPSVDPSPSPSDAVQSLPPAEKTKVNLAVLAGPTGIGAAKLLADAQEGSTENDYEVTIAAAPDEITGKIINGDIDIAAMSTNLAATLFQKTNGEVQIAAINTLGVLYILENGDTIESIGDLQGKTIYAFGQGANPEYVLTYLLEQNGLTVGEDVTVEYKASNEEVVAAMVSGDADVAMLPVPAATTVLMKSETARTALDLTEEWNAVAQDSQLVMGCIVVRKAFAEENKEAVDAFLEEYSASVTYVQENVEEAAELVAGFAITGSAEIAAAAIPQANLTCVTGEDVQMMIQGYYEMLYAADPTSVGGALPDDSFYYIP